MSPVDSLYRGLRELIPDLPAASATRVRVILDLEVAALPIVEVTKFKEPLEPGAPPTEKLIYEIREQRGDAFLLSLIHQEPV